MVQPNKWDKRKPLLFRPICTVEHYHTTECIIVEPGLCISPEYVRQMAFAVFGVPVKKVWVFYLLCCHVVEQILSIIPIYQFLLLN